MKRPELRDFEIRRDQWALYQRGKLKGRYLWQFWLLALALAALALFLVTTVIVFAVSRDLVAALYWGIGTPWMGFPFTIGLTIYFAKLLRLKFIRSMTARLQESQFPQKLKKYKIERKAYLTGPGSAQRRRHQERVQQDVVTYSIYDRRGRQTYIGMTNNPKRREAEHRRSGKLENGGRMVVESRRMTRQNAERLESKKLADYRRRTGRLPRHNKTSNGR